MSAIVLGVVVFTSIVVLLVGLLLLARQRLIPAGEVRIVINDDEDRALRVPVGAPLLSTLAEQRIFVPSACGGQGSCGVCKVRIGAGGGAPLPTELPHLTRAELRDGVRLACQVKVGQDLALQLPPEVFSVRRWRCRVRSNASVATFIKELVLELPADEVVPFRAGGYIQLECPPHTVRYADFAIGEAFRDEWDRLGLWAHVSTVEEPVTRAYSMANYPGEAGIIMLDVRVASPPPGVPGVPPGKVSSYVFGLRPGDEVTISGPYGEFFAREGDAEMMLIGGGAGMAPMRSHILDQLLRLHSTRKITYWYGARSLREAFYRELLDRLAAEHDNFEWHLALSEPQPEDQWEGPTGFIHEVVREQYLRHHPAPEDVEYYLCGPPMMLKACQAMLAELGVDPQNIAFDEF